MREPRNVSLIAGVLALSACATAQLHTEDELDGVARACGLSLGEVIQEQEEKRLLFLYRVRPTREQRTCVYRWAHKNHMNLVVINAVNDPQAAGPES